MLRRTLGSFPRGFRVQGLGWITCQGLESEEILGVQTMAHILDLYICPAPKDKFYAGPCLTILSRNIKPRTPR